MALQKNINSYLTVVEADAYFADRLNSDAWAGDKEAALITATMIVDSHEWEGVARSPTQALAFPREGFYFDPKLGYRQEFPEVVPKGILDAVCEVALHLLTNEDLLNSTGQVTDLIAGPIELTNIKNPSMLPPLAFRFMKPYRANSRRHWFRGW